jgi:hypothetical protein
MDCVTIRFQLVGDEALALRRLATKELRSPADQVRHLVRTELARRRLLATEQLNQEVYANEPQTQCPM